LRTMEKATYLCESEMSPVWNSMLPEAAPHGLTRHMAKAGIDFMRT